MKTFCKRTWLNADTSASTGSVVAWHGETSFREKEPSEIITFFEVSDCHCKARLHKTPADTMAQFVSKMRLLAKNANEFAEYLDSLPNED